MTAMPGMASGRMSRQNVPNGVRPSTSGLVDLARDGVEEALHHPGAERHRDGEVGDDQPGRLVEQAESTMML